MEVNEDLCQHSWYVITLEMFLLQEKLEWCASYPIFDKEGYKLRQGKVNLGKWNKISNTDCKVDEGKTFGAEERWWLNKFKEVWDH